jgi:predicted nucleic acid-binding protein
LTRFVVDASVAVKWVLPEVHSEDAFRLLDEGHYLEAPDLIWAELGNILWKKWRRGEVAREKVPVLLDALRGFPLRSAPCEPLVDLAWEIARDHNRSFYDSLYVAMAVQQGSLAVTADRRLYDALQGVDPALPILWVKDIP